MSSDGPPTPRTVHWREVAVAVALVAFAFWLRTRNLYEVFVGGEVLPTDADCSYHMRRSLLTLEHFPRVPSLDPWVAWPDGARPTNGPGTDLLFAAVAYFFGARGAPDRAEHIIAWVPVALGLATALAAANAAARLEPELRRRASTSLCALVFAVAIPVSVRVSAVGFTDHHVFESLAPLATLAWVATRGSAPTLRWEAWGAAILVGTVGLYPGTLISHALLVAGLALHALFGETPPRRRLVGTGAPAFAMAAGLLGVLVIPWALSHRQWFHHLQLSFLQPALLLGASAALALIDVAARRVPDGAPLARGLRRAALASGALALAVGMAVALVPPLRRELVAGVLGWLFTRDPWMASIAECLPMFQRGFFARASWREMIFKYSLLTPIAPALAVIAVRRVARRDGATAAALGATMLGLLALTLLQHRFARALVGPLSVTAALALAALVDRVAARRSEALRGWSAVALASLWIALDPGVRALMVTVPPAPLDAMHEAEISLRRPGVTVRRGERAGVLTSWDAGNDALLLGRRPVIETGFGPYLGHPVFDASERAWRGSEADLVAWLDRRDVGDVLIGGRHILALGGTRPPLASGVTPDGRTALNVDYLRRYPIALTMLAGSGNARFGLPHLAWLRPRFASQQFLGTFATPLPWAWVYERVRGVRLHGAAPDGTLVRATLPLSIWTRRRIWEGWTRARGGVWSITVPIPTSHREGEVGSGDAYTILFNDRPVGHARASLADVRAGRDIEITAEVSAVAAAPSH